MRLLARLAALIHRDASFVETRLTAFINDLEEEMGLKPNPAHPSAPTVTQPAPPPPPPPPPEDPEAGNPAPETNAALTGQTGAEQPAPTTEPTKTT